MAVPDPRNPPCRCDVIVIGAGLGGLTAGALLAKAGLAVAVFEAQPRPGGYLGGFQRNGFVFDSSIQWLNQCAPGGSTHRIFSHLGDDFPRCRPLARVCRYTGDAFDYLLTSDPTILRNRLIADFPDEERGLRRFFRDAERAGEHAKRLSGRIRTSVTMSAFELLAHAGKMLRESVPLMRHVRVSVEQGLARYFRNPALRNIFCHVESFMSVMMPIGWAYAGDFQAPPQGGGQALVTWLCRQLEAGGGKLFTGRRVAAVRLQDGQRVAGVTLESGETVAAPQVVAACDVETLYEKLLPAGSLPARMLKAQRKADIYYSSFCVYLGLDCSPAALGLDEEVMHLTRDEVPRAEQSGGDPRKTALTIVAPSVRDPTLAPPGKGTLTIHCPAYMHNHGTWQAGAGRERGAAYDAFKKQFADILIDRVEQRLAPGLRQHIEVLESATPLTYWRYTGNKDGSVMGTRPTGNNIRARVGRYRLPIKGLFLGGQWAEYGGGVPLAAKAGANAALLILKGRKKDGYEKLKRVLDDRATATRTIGIPRALGYYVHPGLWEIFFRELGMKVLLSEPSTRNTVERAGLISEPEHCLPVKLLDAHVAELVNAVDLIFVPRILSTLPRHMACPKLGALPDAIQAQFGRMIHVLTVDINENATPLEETLLQLGRSLGRDDDTVRAAIRQGLAAMATCRERRRDRAGQAAKYFLILGHPYNLGDDYLAGPILRKLERLGVGYRFAAHAGGAVQGGPLKWDTCSLMYDTLRNIDPHTCAGVIQLSSFNCGCDSIMSEFFRALLREKQLPYMILILDEHSGQAGVDTRLEAFVDSVGW